MERIPVELWKLDSIPSGTTTSTSSGGRTGPVGGDTNEGYAAAQSFTGVDTANSTGITANTVPTNSTGITANIAPLNAVQPEIIQGAGSKLTIRLMDGTIRWIDDLKASGNVLMKRGEAFLQRAQALLASVDSQQKKQSLIATVAGIAVLTGIIAYKKGVFKGFSANDSLELLTPRGMNKLRSPRGDSKEASGGSPPGGSSGSASSGPLSAPTSGSSAENLATVGSDKLDSSNKLLTKAGRIAARRRRLGLTPGRKGKKKILGFTTALFPKNVKVQNTADVFAAKLIAHLELAYPKLLKSLGTVVSDQQVALEQAFEKQTTAVLQQTAVAAQIASHHQSLVHHHSSSSSHGEQHSHRSDVEHTKSDPPRPDKHHSSDKHHHHRTENKVVVRGHIAGGGLGHRNVRPRIQSPPIGQKNHHPLPHLLMPDSHHKHRHNTGHSPRGERCAPGERGASGERGLWGDRGVSSRAPLKKASPRPDAARDRSPRGGAKGRSEEGRSEEGPDTAEEEECTHGEDKNMAKKPQEAFPKSAYAQHADIQRGRDPSIDDFLDHVTGEGNGDQQHARRNGERGGDHARRNGKEDGTRHREEDGGTHGDPGREPPTRTLSNEINKKRRSGGSLKIVPEDEEVDDWDDEVGPLSSSQSNARNGHDNTVHVNGYNNDDYKRDNISESAYESVGSNSRKNNRADYRDYENVYHEREDYRDYENVFHDVGHGKKTDNDSLSLSNALERKKYQSVFPRSQISMDEKLMAQLALEREELIRKKILGSMMTIGWEKPRGVAAKNRKFGVAQKSMGLINKSLALRDMIDRELRAEIRVKRDSRGGTESHGSRDEDKDSRGVDKGFSILNSINTAIESRMGSTFGAKRRNSSRREQLEKLLADRSADSPRGNSITPRGGYGDEFRGSMSSGSSRVASSEDLVGSRDTMGSSDARFDRRFDATVSRDFSRDFGSRGDGGSRDSMSGDFSHSLGQSLQRTSSGRRDSKNSSYSWLSEDEDKNYSEVVLGLTGAQGSLSMVTAYLAGSALQVVSSVNLEDYHNAYYIITLFWSLTVGITIGGSLYTSICCALLEQYGQIAHSLSIARSGYDKVQFEKKLEEWYTEPGFRKWRTNIVWMFMLCTTPSFFASLGFAAIMKMPTSNGAISFGIFAFFGVCIVSTVLWLNRPFREKVLELKTTFQAPEIVVSKTTENLEGDDIEGENTEGEEEEEQEHLDSKENTEDNTEGSLGEDPLDSTHSDSSKGTEREVQRKSGGTRRTSREKGDPGKGDPKGDNCGITKTGGNPQEKSEARDSDGDEGTIDRRATADSSLDTPRALDGADSPASNAAADAPRNADENQFFPGINTFAINGDNTNAGSIPDATGMGKNTSNTAEDTDATTGMDNTNNSATGTEAGMGTLSFALSAVIDDIDFIDEDCTLGGSSSGTTRAATGGNEPSSSSSSAHTSARNTPGSPSSLTPGINSAAGSAGNAISGSNPATGSTLNLANTPAASGATMRKKFSRNPSGNQAEYGVIGARPFGSVTPAVTGSKGTNVSMGAFYESIAMGRKQSDGNVAQRKTGGLFTSFGWLLGASPSSGGGLLDTKSENQSSLSANSPKADRKSHFHRHSNRNDKSEERSSERPDGDRSTADRNVGDRNATSMMPQKIERPTEDRKSKFRRAKSDLTTGLSELDGDNRLERGDSRLDRADSRGGEEMKKKISSRMSTIDGKKKEKEEAKIKRPKLRV